MTKTVLIVDDVESIRTLIRSYLTEDGFRVVTAANGREALFVARDEKPDLILLDIMMPELGGYEFMRAYQREGEAPIIMLTARVDEGDRVLGLEMGADDYVTKPFSPRELAARVRAVLRRLPGERGPASINHGELTLNFLKHEAFLADKPLNLTPVEFKLLGVLAREPGRVFSRAQLIEKAFGHDFDSFDRTIDVHILKLRRKLESDPRHPKFIKTVYGAGYKLLEVNGDT